MDTDVAQRIEKRRRRFEEVYLYDDLVMTDGAKM